MNKKAVIYFVSAFIIMFSVSVYLISKEVRLSKNAYTITGEYDIRATESSGAESYSDIAEDEEKKTTETSDIFLDINSAEKEDFMKLKGIGEVIAGNIISYRQDSGGFNDIEEIMNVKGIGEKTFLSIKDHIYVKNSVNTTSAEEYTVP